jgi:hypothetical protein
MSDRAGQARMLSHGEPVALSSDDDPSRSEVPWGETGERDKLAIGAKWRTLLFACSRGLLGAGRTAA